MIIVVIKPWQARLIMALAFALFLAGGYRLSEHASMAPVSGRVGLGVPLFEVPGVKNMVSLAVNVDWGAEEIPAILDLFQQYGVKATFFLTGRWAKEHSELARAIAEAGHEIGNHGLTHAHPKQLGADALTEHVAENQSLLEGIVGGVSRLYAPPYGEWDRRIVRHVSGMGYHTVLWTLDTIDWQDPPPAKIVERVVPKARGGSIILMHPRPNTVAALPDLLRGLEQRGLQAVTISTMLAASTATPEHQTSD